MDQEKSEISRITNDTYTAFSEIQYPGDSQIVAMDDDSLEARKIRDLFRGKDWRSIKIFDQLLCSEYFLSGVSGL